MKLAEYQQKALETHITKDPYEALMVSLLGLGGEIGSLLAELKKQRRDGPVYTGFSSHLIEELGDILWYVADLASQVQVVLEDPDPARASRIDAPTAGAAGLCDIALQLQADAHVLGQLLRPDAGPRSPRSGDTIARAVQAVAHDLAVAAQAAGFDITMVAQANLTKIRGRWLGEPNTPAPQFDADQYEEERLPRQIEIQFLERGQSPRQQVLLRVNNITIGDRLTDNSYIDDGYRFHDVFHLASEGSPQGDLTDGEPDGR